MSKVKKKRCKILNPRNGSFVTIELTRYPRVIVPYRGMKTISELIAKFIATKACELNRDVRDENFSVRWRQGDKSVGIVLVRSVDSDYFLTADEVIATLNKQGLRPANPAELLAFGSKYPNVQRYFHIVALGEYCWDEFHGDRVVVIGKNMFSGERYIGISERYGVWPHGYRFAAVRKTRKT